MYFGQRTRCPYTMRIQPINMSSLHKKGGVSKYKCLIFEVNVGTWRAMSAYR